MKTLSRSAERALDSFTGTILYLELTRTPNATGQCESTPTQGLFVITRARGVGTTFRIRRFGSPSWESSLLAHVRDVRVARRARRDEVEKFLKCGVEKKETSA